MTKTQSRFTDFIIRAKKAHGEKFSDANLSNQYVLAYENNLRIQVRFENGIVKRGRVGVTTGWKPSFILLLRSDSIGSCWMLTDKTYLEKILDK